MTITDIEPPPDFQFPHEVLKDGKPAITIRPIHKSDTIHAALKHLVDEARSGRIELESALTLIYYFSINHLTSVLTEGWSSFGQEIGAKDDRVSPMNILDVTLGPQRDQRGGEQIATKGDLATVVFAIGCAIRLSHIPDIRATYREDTKKRLSQHFQVPPLSMSSGGTTFEALLNTMSPLVENTAIRRAMAAADMFLSKHQHHEFANVGHLCLVWAQLCGA